MEWEAFLRVDPRAALRYAARRSAARGFQYQPNLVKLPKADKPASAMPVSRRNMLKSAVGAAIAVLAPRSRRASAAGAVESPVALLMNHVGFTPGASKVTLVGGCGPGGFIVTRNNEALGAGGAGQVVLQGDLVARDADFGQYFAADFSALRDEGTFVLHAGGVASQPFEVRPTIHDAAIRHIVTYFSHQRCGDSKTGYHAPCHLDDGRRPGNWRHHDVTGGWHDACDLRKWVNATLYGMTGLSGVLDRLGAPAGRVSRDAVLDELRWGNRYFLKMQSPEGFVMNYCGGDDGNNWTDNRTGTRDDRVIHVEPCELPAQFHFIAAQAAMTRHARSTDAAYARDCELAARRCLRWCTTKRDPGAATSLAAGLLAVVELHRTTGDDTLVGHVEAFAHRLIALQAIPNAPARQPVTGFFLRAPDDPQPSREIMHGNLPLLALCAIVEHFPSHRDVNAWRDALSRHVDHLAVMAGHGAFGTVPFGLYTGKDPGGNRRIGDYWYRWFMQDHDERSDSDWWVGINAHLASNGLGLARAARLLSRPELAAIAQWQLDWILGRNPFDASTITGVGRNQPALFVTSEFRPVTPPIPGGVMNGIGGTATDKPTLAPGSYNTCEYWTPMVAYTMLLMTELGA
jgi:hypothetical protein